MEFNNNYKKFYPLIRSISYANSRCTGIPKEDFESEMCEALWSAISTFDDKKGCGIETWVTRLLKQAAVRVIKSKEGTYRQRVLTLIDAKPDDDDDKKVVTIEPVDEAAEDEYFRRRYKKEADQRQLIDFLTNDPTQVDHDTTLIVSQFSQYDSITALAKALGMHHEFVKRKLRKLSRRYDVNRFGEIQDYLAV